jgi:hypothetical protein
MKLFSCPVCGATVHFTNDLCTACGARIGFAPGLMAMLAPGPDGAAEGGGLQWRNCTNHARQNGCNWMVADGGDFCRSCRSTRTLPDLSKPSHEVLWQRLEEEKRRLVYAILRLGLPLVDWTEASDGLAFDFLADPEPAFNDNWRVLTGHAAGVITINIAEADPVARERMRAAMAEPYRTILGHLRHESGHYFWDRLVRDSDWLDPFRALFGDERQDYAAALRHHHAEGPPSDWHTRHVSAYAACHPWEDWAESWSHYLHMIDTLETAAAFGLRLETAPPQADEAAFGPYAPQRFDNLIARWLPLTVALNALNASMGHDPAYPFTLPDPVLAKLGFVHDVVHKGVGLR